MKKFLLISGMIILLKLATAQHQDPSWSVRRAILNEQCLQNDSLCNILQSMGVFEGHVRTFFMGTVNYAQYPDYYALATGAGLAYFSPIIKNFQAGLSGFTIYNLSSSVLHPAPPFTNRYELQLFDITNPDNHSDLDRLEDLYLRYYLSKNTKSFIQAGKFHLKTPLINLQDGRMRPNLQEGLWVEWNELKRIKLSGGFLWRSSPRGTVRWYTISQSAGIYPQGRAIDGSPAEYAGKANSKGIFILNMKSMPTNHIEVQGWNYLADNMFNTIFVQSQWKKPYHLKEWVAGLQFVHQHSLAHAGIPISEQYFDSNSQSVAISLRTGFTQLLHHEKWFINYTHITRQGRFLFPREWGVEPFYTFMWRERVEGAGGVHAFMLEHVRYLNKRQSMNLHTQLGLTNMPSLNNYRLNKYNMPSYYHMNLKASYSFGGFLHGLKADLLYTYKGPLNRNTEISPANYHNKVYTHLFSVILDYYF